MTKSMTNAELAIGIEIATVMLAEALGHITTEQAAARMGLTIEVWEEDKEENSQGIKEYVASPHKSACDLCDEPTLTAEVFGFKVPEDPNARLQFYNPPIGQPKHLCHRCVGSVTDLGVRFIKSAEEAEKESQING